LSHEQENELRANFPLSRKLIEMFSKKFETHPAAIIGRFARNNPELNKLGWALGFFEKIELE